MVLITSRCVGGQAGRPEKNLDRALPSTYSNGCHLPQMESIPLRCFSSRARDVATIYLVGDSHAAQWIPGIEFSSQRDSLSFRFVTKSSCPFVPLNLNLNCERWIKNVLGEIKRFKPEVVIMSNLTNGKYLNFYTDDAYTKFWITELESIFNKIPRNSKVVFIEDTPYSTFDTSECLLSRHQDDCKFDLQTSALTLEIRKFALTKKLPYISFNHRLCPSSKCLSGDSSINFFRDENHISISASKRFGSTLIKRVKEALPDTEQEFLSN